MSQIGRPGNFRWLPMKSYQAIILAEINQFGGITNDNAINRRVDGRWFLKVAGEPPHELLFVGGNVDAMK